MFGFARGSNQGPGAGRLAAVFVASDRRVGCETLVAAINEAFVAFQVSPVEGEES